MVAAGSVVAAVQGLYLKSLDASFSSQNLTNLLSQVIGSDPVCRHILMQCETLNMQRFVTCVHLKRCVLQDCLRACQEQIEALLESSLQQAQHHGSTAQPKCVAGDADLSCTPTDVRDVNIWNCWWQWWVMDLVFSKNGVKVVTGISSKSCWCPCVPRWNQVHFCSVILETTQERNDNSCWWRMRVSVEVTIFECIFS